MPSRLACDEAMNLSKARLKVQDPDLKHGQVETTLVAGSIHVPWGMQGGFAVVYKFRTQSGKFRALRCYLASMDPADMQYRYERIGAYFARHIPDITAGFKFHSDGILIYETVGGVQTKRPFSLIEMEWIEGTTLVDHVAALCQQGDSAGLGNILEQWVEIIEVLRTAKIAHCALSGSDIMVRKADKRLILIDYDGVYIPDFIGKPGIVLGEPDYQHPQVNLRPFNEEADTFSAMVIYTALLALHLRPQLWNTYTSMQTTTLNRMRDTNLLFKSSDFAAPESSPLFSELETINDARLSAVVRDLKRACSLPINQVRLPLYLIDPDIEKKEVLTKFVQAIQDNDDEAIVQAWAPQLDNYPPAQQYRSRMKQAEQVAQKLRDLREALKRGSLQQISVYDPILDQSKSFTSQERERLRLARKLQEAFNTDDDSAIVTTWEEIRQRNYVSFFHLTWQQEQRRTLAQRRTTAMVKVFFCYAHEDKALLDRLKRHLKPLQREGLIEVWHDQDISAGAEWEKEIKEHLNKADIILLLVSPDFMYSDYCYSIEMNRAIERHEAGEARVIPVIVRPTYWQGILGKLQALPTDAQPVTSSKWPSLDEAFFDVTEGIREIVEKMASK